MKEHTYEHRMQDMLLFLAERGFKPKTREARGYVVEELIKEAGGQTELAEYLSRFRKMEKITLSDIKMDIEKGEGDISRTEMLFLIMKEMAA
jgi:hypothetical protein